VKLWRTETRRAIITRIQLLLANAAETNVHAGLDPVAGWDEQIIVGPAINGRITNLDWGFDGACHGIDDFELEIYVVTNRSGWTTDEADERCQALLGLAASAFKTSVGRDFGEEVETYVGTLIGPDSEQDPDLTGAISDGRIEIACHAQVTP
jgi:hypothetical protein